MRKTTLGDRPKRVQYSATLLDFNIFLYRPNRPKNILVEFCVNFREVFAGRLVSLVKTKARHLRLETKVVKNVDTPSSAISMTNYQVS